MLITSEMLRASNKRLKKIWLVKAQKEINAVLYNMGRKKPNFPVPAVHCSKVVWFPEGHWAREPGPYINLLGYNGAVGIYGPGYYTVHCWRVG